MKKALLSLLSLSAIVLVACGPSKTYTASETAANEAMTQLETVVDMNQVPAIVGEFDAKLVTIATENGELAGEEATKITTLTEQVKTLGAAKLDSLNKVAMAAAEAAMVEAAAMAAAEEEAAKTAKKK